MRRSLQVLALSVLLALGGCGGDETSCGDAGCPDALLLRLGYPAAASFGVRGTIDGEAFTCVGHGTCTAGPLAGRVTLWQAEDRSWELRIFGDAEVVELELVRETVPAATARVEPEYGEPFRPNGPDCAPTCRSAEVTVAWTAL